MSKGIVIPDNKHQNTLDWKYLKYETQDTDGTRPSCYQKVFYLSFEGWLEKTTMSLTLSDQKSIMKQRSAQWGNSNCQKMSEKLQRWAVKQGN